MLALEVDHANAHCDEGGQSTLPDVDFLRPGMKLKVMDNRTHASKEKQRAVRSSRLTPTVAL